MLNRVIYILFILLITSCENDNRPNYHFYPSEGYQRNTPFNYISFKKHHLYIMRKQYSFFDESVIEIPFDKDSVGNKAFYNLCYYNFDISTTNGLYQNRNLDNERKKSLRNISQLIFQFNLPKIPNFKNLTEFLEDYSKSIVFDENLVYLIYVVDSNKTFIIDGKDGFSKFEVKILKWLIFLKKISFVDSMYYDRLIGVNKNSFNFYLKKNDYIIPNSFWEK